MKSVIKKKIAAKLESIKKYEKNKKVQEKMFFGDPAVIAKALADDYEELGELYLKASDLRNAIKAFKKAQKADIAFIKSEFSFDKKFMEKTIGQRKKYWAEKLKRIRR